MLLITQGLDRSVAILLEKLNIQSDKGLMAIKLIKMLM